MKNKEIDPDYIEGFNKGYALREFKPDLAMSLSQTKFPDSDLDFDLGMKDGIKQKELELIRERDSGSENEQTNDMER